MKKIISKQFLIIALLLAIGVLFGSPRTLSAASLGKKTIKVGKSVNLKVKKDADWGISNTQVARMVGLSDKKVKVTGLAAGKTQVVAKVGKTKYKATIKVIAVKKNTGSSAGSSGNVEQPTGTAVPGSADKAYSNGIVGHFDETFANSVIAQTNFYRAGKRIGTLAKDNVLTQAAKTRAIEAAVSFSHTRPNGQAYYTVAGSSKDSPVYGENLAKGYTNAQSTLSAWIASPSHLENLVRDFTSIGVAVFMMKNADGTYYPYIAQLFGY